MTEISETPEQRFGTRLADARRQYGWTQQQLTEAMNERGFSWGATTATKTEQGGRPIRVDEAVALCELFGTTVDELVTTSADAEAGRLLRELLRATAERGRAERAVQEAERELEKRKEHLQARATARDELSERFNQQQEARNGEHHETP